MDNLIAKLSEQQALLDKQKNVLASNDKSITKSDLNESTPCSGLPTPADNVNTTPATEASGEETAIQPEPATSYPSAAAMNRLKKELADTKNRLARKEQELHQTINAKPYEPTKASRPATLPTHVSDGMGRQYGIHDDAKSDASDMSHVSHTGAFPRAPNHMAASSATGGYHGSIVPPTANIWGQGSRAFANRPMVPALQPLMVPQNMSQAGPMRNYSSPTSPTSGNGRYLNDFNQNHAVYRRNTRGGQGGHFPARSQANGSWDSYGSERDSSPMMSLNNPFQPMGMFQASPLTYQPRPIGTPLSPTAAEFNNLTGPQAGPWNSAVSLYLCTFSDILTMLSV